MYTVPMTDVHGKEWVIEAAWLNDLASEVSKVDIMEMAAMLLDARQIERLVV